MFPLASLSKFFTRVGLVPFVWYSYRTRVASVALVSNSCCLCLTLVVRVALMSQSCCSCLALVLQNRLDLRNLVKRTFFDLRTFRENN